MVAGNTFILILVSGTNLKAPQEMNILRLQYKRPPKAIHFLVELSVTMPLCLRERRARRWSFVHENNNWSKHCCLYVLNLRLRPEVQIRDTTTDRKNEVGRGRELDGYRETNENVLVLQTRLKVSCGSV